MKKDKRLDLAIRTKEFSEGQVIFMAVAER
jgi:hypothetical protein